MNYSSLIRLILFGIFLYAVPAYCDAQVGKISLADTLQAKILLDSSKYWMNNFKPDKALSEANEAKNILEKLGEVESKRFATALYLVGTSYNILGNAQDALPQLEAALILRLRLYGSNHYEVGITMNEIGGCYLNLNAFDKSLDFFENALKILKTTAEEYPNDLAICLNNMGICYDQIGDYDQAISFYNQSLAIRRKKTPENDPENVGCYINLGFSYSNKGEFEKAIYFIEKAISIRLKKYGEVHPSLFMPYNNLGSVYSRNKDPEKGIQYLEIALDLANKVYGDSSYQSIYTNINLGEVYTSIEDYEKSFFYAKKALDLGIKILGEDNILVAMSYANTGYVQILRGNYPDAILNLNRGLTLQKSIFGDKSPNLSRIYGGLGFCHVKMQDFENSFKYFDDGLECLGYKDRRDFQDVQDFPVLTDFLSVMGLCSQTWYASDHHIAHLYEARSYHRQALAAFEHQARNNSPTVKLDVAAQSANVHAAAVSTDYLLQQLTDSVHYRRESFDFAERSKAFLLYQALQEAQALKFAGIPETLLQQEKDFRQEIAYYDKKRQDKRMEGVAENDTALLDLNDKLFNLNRSYETLKREFEEKYPQYYKAKYDLSTVSIAEVQRELLAPEQSLLEYLVGDSNIYTFIIRKDTFLVKEIKLDFPLDKWVNDLTKDGIYGFYGLPKGHPEKTAARQKACDENYTRAAQQLYQKLLLPVEDQLTERVIIIPDGVLGYVPFEALLTKAPARPEAFSYYIDDYFINKHQVSYSYSATLLREMKHEQDKPYSNGGVLAMAPFFRGDTSHLLPPIDSSYLETTMRDALDPLDFSGREVKAITKLWGGESFYNQDASLEKFRELANNYRILHLSTHGKADDRQGDYAFLAFSTSNDSTFSKLYARDLYNFSLHADLVMLSACETGIGKLRKGEGIVSLARAFAYAGAKSIFTTLWKVSDGSMIDLTVPFYKYLKNGWPKDQALRQSKLDYLQKHKGSGGAVHPFFWAGMIGIGDMESLH